MRTNGSASCARGLRPSVEQLLRELGALRRPIEMGEPKPRGSVRFAPAFAQLESVRLPATSTRR